jgi:hypothetical protein
MQKFNMSSIFHFYILGLTSWIWTSSSTKGLKFENPSKGNSYEGFNSEHCSQRSGCAATNIPTRTHRARILLHTWLAPGCHLAVKFTDADSRWLTRRSADTRRSTVGRAARRANLTPYTVFSLGSLQNKLSSQRLCGGRDSFFFLFDRRLPYWFLISTSFSFLCWGESGCSVSRGGRWKTNVVAL